jgi:hypothetical protein
VAHHTDCSANLSFFAISDSCYSSALPTIDLSQTGNRYLAGCLQGQASRRYLSDFLLLAGLDRQGIQVDRTAQGPGSLMMIGLQVCPGYVKQQRLQSHGYNRDAKRTGDNIPGARRNRSGPASRPRPNEGPAMGAFSALAACNGADDQERLLTRGDSFG